MTVSCKIFSFKTRLLLVSILQLQPLVSVQLSFSIFLYYFCVPVSLIVCPGNYGRYRKNRDERIATRNAKNAFPASLYFSDGIGGAEAQSKDSQKLKGFCFVGSGCSYVELSMPSL